MARVNEAGRAGRAAAAGQPSAGDSVPEAPNLTSPRVDDSRTWMSLLPVYAVVFAGFVGYSLMITVFTPMLMRGDGPFLTAGEPMAKRTILLGFLLCLYPLGQFAGSPVLGGLSDRYGRKPILLISLFVTTLCYALIATALTLGSFALLAAASLLAGLAEANIVTAQSAIADVIAAQERNRYFGYIYMCVSAAYILGPLAGGKLADPHLVPWFRYQTPFCSCTFTPSGEKPRGVKARGC